ncbi:hypothetical protein E3V35_12475 [Streptococcus pseudopneumoniae]|nr:hypothetical protein E3V35_12475 [Streptococcus pseudopneumoniae]
MKKSTADTLTLGYQKTIYIF